MAQANEAILARCPGCGNTFSVTLKPSEKEGTITGSVLRDCPRCGDGVYVWTGRIINND